jgi:hypothetical protein
VGADLLIIFNTARKNRTFFKKREGKKVAGKFSNMYFQWRNESSAEARISYK